LHQNWCKNRWGHGVPTLFAAFTEHEFMLFRAGAYLFWLPVRYPLSRPYPGPDAAPVPWFLPGHNPAHERPGPGHPDMQAEFFTVPVS
jgi:hypothetical protein